MNRTETIPRPVTPGEETAALERFHRDGDWTGRIEPGGMGPDTPAQFAFGRATHRWIQDGRWVVGDFEQDQYLEDGTYVMKWQLHWVCGWDPGSATYRATIADCYGHAEVLTGRIEGDVMIFESDPTRVPQLRLTWDASLPEAIRWRNEMRTDGGTWILIEEYEIVPT